MRKDTEKVRIGPVTVKIRPVQEGKYKGFVVFYRTPSRQLVRIKRADYAEAKALANQVARKLADGREALEISKEEQLEYLEAKKLLPPGKRLIDAVNILVRQTTDQALQQKPFEEARIEFLAAKKADNISASHLKDLTKRLKYFGEFYQGSILGVRGPAIDDWLRKLKVAPKTRNNYRGALSSFFAFAKAKGYLPRDWQEMDFVSVAKNSLKGAVEIFTPEESEKLLNGAKNHQLPFLALGLFGGIRHEEIKRLRWEHINFETGWITLNADVVKRHRTARRRLVPLQANLKAWLSDFKQTSGAICTHKNMSNEMRLLAQSVGMKWKHNAPRHSYCSYRLAEIKDAAKVATEMGNSERKIFTNYKELVSESEAKKYFSIMPKRPEKGTTEKQA